MSDSTRLTLVCAAPPPSGNVENAFAALFDFSARARAAFRDGRSGEAYRLVLRLILMHKPRDASPGLAALFERRRARVILELSDLDVSLRATAPRSA